MAEIRTPPDYTGMNIGSSISSQAERMRQKRVSQDLRNSLKDSSKQTFSLNEKVSNLDDSVLDLSDNITDLSEQVKKLRSSFKSIPMGSSGLDIDLDRRRKLTREPGNKKPTSEPVNYPGKDASKQGSKQTSKEAPKQASKEASKQVSKEVSKQASKSMPKQVAKQGGKALGKSALKKIPILGAVAGLGFGIERALQGDFMGALMEVGSGAASTIPGVGTGASLGIDAALVARDIYKSSSESEEVKENIKAENATEIPKEEIQLEMPDDLVEAQEDTKELFENTVSLLKDLVDAYKDGSDKHGFIGGIFNLGSTAVLKSVGAVSNAFSSQPSYYKGEPIKTEDGLGGLSARFESAKAGSKAIGYDRVGGTSYGKYQIASNTGTFDRYLQWLDKQGVQGQEVASRLRNAGPANSGGRGGATAEEWKRLVDEGKMGNFEHDFIKATHFDPAFKSIKSDELRDRIQKSSTLQDVLWSTAVQHGPAAVKGGAAQIFNNVYREGMSDEELINAVYNNRRDKFGSSTAAVQQSANNRMTWESQRAKGMLQAEKASKVEEKQVLTAESSEPTMSFIDYLTKVEKRRLTREADYGLGFDGLAEAEERYKDYLKKNTSIEDNKSSLKSAESVMKQAETLQSNTPQMQVAQSPQSSSKLGSLKGSIQGPIPDGDYDKLTALSRGDLA